ncbi:DUF1330 domain-containing protein [Nocardioides campestrisoli]|uniref:DUF1330 domain-containing protein n=1 Tax=Nocardioides campestrisoli TaxID=2736757 RepID=UPI0015E67C2A|nr:DUF1330 domain-containing protein [Nocardioides campestrisoli]
MTVDPGTADLETFLATAPDEPFVMLNLMRYAEGGRALYTEYLRRAAPYVEAAGARVLYLGKGGTPLVGGDAQAWDAVMLVWYPSPAAFTAMVDDPEYVQVSHLRAQALAAAVLQPSRPLVS